MIWVDVDDVQSAVVQLCSSAACSVAACSLKLTVS